MQVSASAFRAMALVSGVMLFLAQLGARIFKPDLMVPEVMAAGALAFGFALRAPGDVRPEKDITEE